MAAAFNVEEIVSIGIEIEKNGRIFYKKAAETTTDSVLKATLEQLAAWESEHIYTFETIKRELASASTDESWYANEESQGYFKAAADSHVFIQNSDIPSLLSDCDTPLDIFEMALRFEKDSIVLYQTLKELVNPALGGHEELDKVIKEELMHVAYIQKQINALL